jgi:hypothetical protein
MGKVAEKYEPVWKITFSTEQLENKACPNLKKKIVILNTAISMMLVLSKYR